MAKAEQPRDTFSAIPKQDASDVQQLAEKMFLKFWEPGDTVRSKNPEAFAAMCFIGAQQFLRIAARISEGQKPESIISPE